MLEGDAEPLALAYSFHEEEFIASRYNHAPLDYVKLFYGESARAGIFTTDDEYLVGIDLANDTDAEILTTEEAEQALIEIQYAAATGDHFVVNCEMKRKFDMWIKFNPALFSLFKSLHEITSNVDYRPIV